LLDDLRVEKFQAAREEEKNRTYCERNSLRPGQREQTAEREGGAPAHSGAPFFKTFKPLLLLRHQRDLHTIFRVEVGLRSLVNALRVELVVEVGNQPEAGRILVVLLLAG
jgi:hypothetical protein